MPRHWLFLLGLVAALLLPVGGCRSCSSCHDYDPPVANCECDAYGCHRAGSASGPYVDMPPVGEEYGEYVVEPPVEESAVEEWPQP